MIGLTGLLRLHNHIQSILQQKRWKGVLRIVRAIIIIGALLLMLAGLIMALRELRTYQVNAFDLRLALIAQSSILIASMLGGLVWYATLRAFGHQVPWRQGLIMHMASNVGKYLPGYGWQHVGKGYLVKNEVGSTQSVTLLLATEIGIILSSGAFFALLVSAIFNLKWGRLFMPEWVLVAGVLTIGLATIAWAHYVIEMHIPPISNPKTTTSSRLTAQYVRWIWLGIAWAAASGGWLSFAIGCWCFISAIYPTTIDLLPLTFIALTLATLVGLLIVFIPAGLGIREVTMAALLAPVLPFSLTVIVSLFLRVSVITCELLELGLVLMWTKYWPKSLRTLVTFQGAAKDTPNGVL